MQFNLTQLVKICNPSSSESKKPRSLKSISLQINQETEKLNNDEINLNREYNRQKFDLRGQFNKVFHQISQAFNSQNFTININIKKPINPYQSNCLIF